MVETLRVCAVLGVISRTSQTQHKATGGVGGGAGVNIEIHRLGPKSDKHRLEQRDSEDMETSSESYTEVTVVRQNRGAFASCPAWARS